MNHLYLIYIKNNVHTIELIQWLGRQKKKWSGLKRNKRKAFRNSMWINKNTDKNEISNIYVKILAKEFC